MSCFESKINRSYEGCSASCRPIQPSDGIYSNLVFTSGQIAIIPDGQPLTDHPIRIQTRPCLENISVILNEAGTDVEDILTATVFLKKIDSYAEMNTASDGFFESDPPARTAIEVGNLPLDADVEIQAIAVGER